MVSLLLLLIALFPSVYAHAWDCMDCDKKCCKRGFGVKVCEPACSHACAIANVGCGRVEIPTSPITPPIFVPPPSSNTVVSILTVGW